MSPEDVRRVAEAAGMRRMSYKTQDYGADVEILARAFAIVRREALEEAAKVCDDTKTSGGAGYVLMTVAEQIRALAATERG